MPNQETVRKLSTQVIARLAAEGVPVVGHVGLIPSRRTWTGGFKAVGRTAESARLVWQQIRALEDAGAFAAEIEVVPRKLTDKPPGEFVPYRRNGGPAPEFARAGDGYRFHATGLTHDERGYPDMTAAAQDKLVRCGKGALFDVVVDIRKGSPNFGQWFGTELSFENGCQLLVPAGFAHGFVTRAPDTEIIYKCSDDYAPDVEGALLWNDADVGIDWGIDPSDAVLSAKDNLAPTLATLDSPFTFEASR